MLRDLVIERSSTSRNDMETGEGHIAAHFCSKRTIDKT